MFSSRIFDQSSRQLSQELVVRGLEIGAHGAQSFQQGLRGLAHRFVALRFIAVSLNLDYGLLLLRTRGPLCPSWRASPWVLPRQPPSRRLGAVPRPAHDRSPPPSFVPQLVGVASPVPTTSCSFPWRYFFPESAVLGCHAEFSGRLWDGGLRENRIGVHHTLQIDSRRAACSKARRIAPKSDGWKNGFSNHHRGSCRIFRRCRSLRYSLSPYLPTPSLSFSLSFSAPRCRNRSHRLAGRSTGRCGHGHTPRLCTRVCSKGKAVLEPSTTLRLPGALPSPPQPKSASSKGKAGLQPSTTVRLQAALHAPPKHKSPHPKGKAGPEHAPTPKRPGALPSPHQHKYPNSKGKAVLEPLPTSTLPGALPSPHRNK